MKRKYFLLFFLFSATLALGAFVFSSAHLNSELSSNKETMSGAFEQEAKEGEGVVKETVKEAGVKATESVARFLFSLIYK